MTRQCVARKAFIAVKPSDGLEGFSPAPASCIAGSKTGPKEHQVLNIKYSFGGTRWYSASTGRLVIDSIQVLDSMPISALSLVVELPMILPIEIAPA
jgi:hypothetical protein